MNKILLQCDNLCKRYQEGSVQTDVLHNVSFSVGEGEMMAIVGSSGSGKSTLLHLLGGLDTPTSGDVIFNGQPMSKLSSAAKAELRNQKLGFIYQFHHLLPDFTALENVAMPLLIGKKKPAEINSRALEMLKAVGLDHRANHRPSELSGGERQRVAIARALVNNPRLVLADEPTGSVDTATSKLILDVFRELNRAMGVTIIIVTHDTKLSAQIDRVVAIRDGKTSTELVRKPGIAKSFGELTEQEETSHEELTVLDRAGRLQIPKEYLEELGLKGGDKVRVELEEGRISIYPRGIADKAK